MPSWPTPLGGLKDHRTQCGSFSPRPINHTQTGLEAKHSTILHGHPFPLLLHLRHKIFVVKLAFYKNMQQNLGTQRSKTSYMRVFFFSSNVKQFQEKWSHSLGCLFSVLRKEPLSKGKRHCLSTLPALVWQGPLADALTLIWYQKTKTPTRGAFSFGDVKEETLVEAVRVINI